ncbi:MAG: rhomboid family intramembrane serine protease [Bacteroidales bacterium]|nr:rhomboid family intramembrane serine protease [Bacteroidales bacterium]
MANVPTVTKNLIITNVIMFVATLFGEDFMVGTFAMFFPASPYFRWWQILTHMFMHGGFWHIFFNMYTLFIFGTALERTIGSKKFLVYYFITGLGAVALHTGVEYLQAMSYASAGNTAALHNLYLTPTLGASGAIYGVLIGYAMMYPDSVLTLIFPPVSLKAKWFVLIFAGIELLTGVTGTADGVAHFAHLGGMLIGWLLMLYWKKTHKIWDRDSWI